MAAGMGFLGALGGLGKGVENVGDTMLRDSLQRRQQAQDDERRMRIEEFRIVAERTEGDRRYERERADKLADSELDHKRDLEKIDATARGKATNKRDKDMFGKVELTNGQVVSESDLRSEYQTRYGKFDPMGNLIAMDEGAPTYDVYRNQQVLPEYRRRFGGEDVADGMSSVDARAAAEREANENDPIGPNWMRGDATKKAFGEGGREAWINNRALELQGKKTQNDGVRKDTVQEGVPQGSRQIGTSGGKPVYEAPNGKRYIVE